MSEGQLVPADCFVAVYGDDIGQRYDLSDEPAVFGRSEEAQVFIDSEHVSREHCVVERDGRHRYITDLESTNGTYVNDKPISRHRLASGDLVQLGEAMFKYLREHDLTAAYFEEIHQIAITDGLTSVSNKRALNEFLEREFARSRRHGRDLSVLLVDLDHFAQVNDQLGHIAGDLILREFATVLMRRVRRDEMFARHDGTRFAIVLPESAAEGATAYAEILREMVEAYEFVIDDATVSLTVSVGVGTFNPHMATPQDLIRAAEGKLFDAKQSGRNCVVV